MSKDNDKSKKKNIIVFPNKDKDGWIEKWDTNRDWLNFPWPSRILISANPGSGKTNMIKNILLKAKPFFNRIFLCHYDEDTEEYDDIECIKLKDIPDAKGKLLKNSKKHKSALIIDDHEFQFMDNKSKKNLDRLLGYTSTHLGLTIIIATQNFFNLPTFVRRMSDVFILWKGSSDFDSLYSVGRKMGLSKEEFKSIMNKCQCKYDNIIIDLTANSPCKVRLNGYTPLDTSL
jgi:hypothetical protein